MKRIVILLVFLFAVVTSLSAQQLASIERYLNLALSAYEEGRCDDVISFADKAMPYIDSYIENNKNPQDLEEYTTVCYNYCSLLYILGHSYLKKQEYQNAIEALENFALICTHILGESHQYYAASLGNLALCYNEIGNYAQAIEINKQTLKILKHNLGENHPDYAITLNNLANCYYTTADYAQAIELQKQALEIRKRVLGENHPGYATSLNNLALCYNEIGDYVQAIELQKQALEIRKRVLGENHPGYATSLNNLARCYSDIGDYAQAIELHKQALEIDKRVLGENHPDYATSLNNLAGCYSDIGDYAQAIELQKQALEIDKRVLGENHPDYAKSLNNLANCYYTTADYAQAIELQKQALEIRKRVLGENHPDYAVSLNNLANCYYTTADYAQAIELYKQALEIGKRVLGKNHPGYATSLSNLANCYYTTADYAQAIELQKQALEIRKRVLGENHPNYAESLNNLAECYSDIGDYVQAIELQKQALEIRKRVLGKNHPGYATSLSNLARCYSDIGDYVQAIELQKQALEIDKRVLGENHPGYATSLNNLALCYNEIGDYAQAIELQKQALEIGKRVLGENHPDYAKSLNNLAACYSDIGDYERAIELQKQALEIRKRVLGKNHPGYATSLNNLAVYYRATGDYVQAIELHKQALEIYKRVVGEEHPSYVGSLNYMMVYYYSSGTLSNIPRLWQESFSLGKKYVLTQLGNMTSVERQRFWQQEGFNFLFACNTYSKPLAYDTIALETAYNSMLLTKGMLLSLDIEFSKIIQESGNNELLQKYEEFRLSNAILTKYYEKPIDERPQQEVERLEKRIEELERDLIAGSKEFADFTRRLATSWADVRDALGKNDVAIEIIAADNGYIDKNATPYYAALVLRKEWTTPKFVELCTADELKKLHDFGYNLYNAANAPQLYEIIWGKLSKYLNDGDNIYFSPSGLLHQINVEILQDSQGNYANRRYNIQRVSSTREACFKKHPKERSHAALYGGLKYDMDSSAMLAQSAIYKIKNDYIATRGLLPDSTDRAGWNELSGTLEEVNNVQRLMRKCNINTTLFSGQIGTEESFKALSGKRIPIIHLATHGFFFKNETVKNVDYFRNRMIGNNVYRPDNSLKRSGLVFSGAQKAWLGERIPESVEDGILLAEEITDLDLRDVELVVLSACETGLGDITSEGVFGLQRAFKKAGVQTIIMSLWKVDDQATSLMMETFYENLLNGKSKKQSFLIAQRTVKDKFPNPYYWASFIMLD